MMEQPAVSQRQPNGRRLPIAPFVAVLARRRGLIIGLTLATAFVAASFSLISPVTYESSATILPPEQSSSFGLGVGGLASSLANLQLGFAQANASALYADMLVSRSVRRFVIDKLELIEAYGLASVPDTLRAVDSALAQLETDISVVTLRNGMIVLQTRAHTGFFAGAAEKETVRRRSAQIADALAEGLEVINRRKNTNQARRARLYLEEQLALNDAALDASSRDLADFQREHLAISLDDQMRVGIETAGTLEAEILAREVALGVASQTMYAGNPEVRRLQSELASLRDRLAQLQRGASFPRRGGGSDSLVLGLEELPELGRQYAFKLREVKIQEKLFELLTEQLYHARLKETETLPVIQVLDEARVPVWKKSPIVRKTALIAALLGFFLAVLIAHLLEWWQGYAWREEDRRVIRDLLRR